MNVKHQDPVVSKQLVKESNTRVVYSSPKAEEISFCIQGVILDSPGTGTVDPFVDD